MRKIRIIEIIRLIYNFFCFDNKNIIIIIFIRLIIEILFLRSLSAFEIFPVCFYFYNQTSTLCKDIKI